MAKLMETRCSNCNEMRTTVVMREHGMTVCDACWADALAYGHMHGLHVDEDGTPVVVDGCPSCAGHTPAEYRI